MLMPLDEHSVRAREEEQAAKLPVRLSVSDWAVQTDSPVQKVKIAVWTSFVANVILSALQRELHRFDTFTRSC